MLTYGLTHIPVLEESFFCHVCFLQVNTQFQILDHDRLQNFFRISCRSVLLALDNLCKGIQSPGGLSNFDELYNNPLKKRIS